MENTQATPSAAPEHDAHGEPDFKLYIMIFVGLCVLTLVSYVTYELMTKVLHLPGVSLVIIMLVSIAKATLVGMFFMHLKWDWSRLYFLVIPVVIMGVMMIIVLLPDIVFAWHAR